MDSNIQLRKKIHDFIDQADDKTLQIFNAIISSEQASKPVIPESFYKELDEDREKHLIAETPSHTWEDVKERLSKKL